jgi:Ni/Co efflux regulator RcnB
MTRNILLAAGAALMLGFAAPAMAAVPSHTPGAPSAQHRSSGVQVAQRHHRDRDRDRHGRRHRRDRDRWGRHHRDPHAWRHRHPHARAGRPHWSRGDRLYRDYWGPRYYVHDWHRYHLRRPPRGYRWVRVGDEFLLVAISTGIIMDVLLNH